MKLWGLFLFLPSFAWAYTPAPSASSQSIDANFLDLSQEIQRRDLHNGGTVRQNLIFSSSTMTQGDVTVNSSFTVNGPAVFNGTVSLGPSVQVSSYTFVPAGSTVQTTLGVCYATVTVSVAAVPIRVVMTGAMQTNAEGGRIVWSVLVNGNFPSSFPPLTKDAGITAETAVANRYVNMSASRRLASQGSGSTNFCWTASVPNGNGSSINVNWGDTNYDVVFGVEEIH